MFSKYFVNLAMQQKPEDQPSKKCDAASVLIEAALHTSTLDEQALLRLFEKYLTAGCLGGCNLELKEFKSICEVQLPKFRTFFEHADKLFKFDVRWDYMPWSHLPLSYLESLNNDQLNWITKIMFKCRNNLADKSNNTKRIVGMTNLSELSDAELRALVKDYYENSNPDEDDYVVIEKTETRIYPDDFNIEKTTVTVPHNVPYFFELKGLTRKVIEEQHPSLLNYYYIRVEGAPTSSGKAIIAKCIIDKDYPDNYYCYILNYTGESVEFEVKVKLTFGVMEGLPDWRRDIYTSEIFNYFPGAENFDNIVYFYKSSKEAAAFDLVFDKAYIIHPKGHLTIKLPLTEAYRYRDCFGIRSSLAKQGIFLTWTFKAETYHNNERAFEIQINNMSPNQVELGSRFIWFMPEANVSFKENVQLGVW